MVKPAKGGGAAHEERESIEEELHKGDGDGLEDAAHKEDDADESQPGRDADPDDGGEGEEADGDGGEDAPGGEKTKGRDGAEDDVEEDGEEEDVEDDEDGDSDGGLKDLVVEQGRQIQQLTKILSERQEKPQEITPEQWEQVEESTGLKKNAYKFLADRLLAPALKSVVSKFSERLAQLETASAFSSMAADPRFKDVGAYRATMEKFLEAFSPEARTNQKVMRMAYFAAKGMGTKKAVADEGRRREVRKKITVDRRPGAGGKSGGGKEQVKLTPMQEEAAKHMPGGRAAYIKEKQDIERRKAGRG